MFQNTLHYRFLVRLLTGLTLLNLVSGCARTNDYLTYRDYINPEIRENGRTLTDAQILEKVKLRDASGSVRSPFFSGSQSISPFGAIINIDKGSFCNVTHWEGVIAATNLHCVPEKNLGTHDLRIIYFDHQGVQQITRVKSLYAEGATKSEDWATLTLPAEAAEQWPALRNARNNFVPTSDTPKNPSFSRVTVWSYTVDTQESAKTSKFIANMKPNICRLYFQEPQHKLPGEFQGASQNSETWSCKIIEGEHFFIDTCDRDPVKGDSGSWVTYSPSTHNNDTLDRNFKKSYQEFTENIGVLHWVFQAKENTRYSTHIGETKDPFKSIQAGAVLYSVGTRWSALLEKNRLNLR